MNHWEKMTNKQTKNNHKCWNPSNQMTITSNDFSHPNGLCLIPSRKISLWLFTSDLKGVNMTAFRNLHPFYVLRSFPLWYLQSIFHPTAVISHIKSKNTFLWHKRVFELKMKLNSFKSLLCSNQTSNHTLGFLTPL